MKDLIRRSDAIKAVENVTWYHQNRNKDMVSGANSDEHQAWYKADDVYKALEAVPTADRPQGWIPCSERLPSEKEIVLITNDKGNVRFGQFRGTHGKYWIWKGNTLEIVLAWMPLPKPWKGADDD